MAAAGLLGSDIGWLTIIGIAICIPVGIIGYFVAKYLNRKTYPLSIEVLEQLQLRRRSRQRQTRHRSAIA
ncbi:hypothetical protein [Serratia odorifera]|uniref:GntT/GntP/DsdX family permease n=1 Tax=Serratia odorifera TaxID=618 RepID=UPI0024116A58|nr:hypothetical protein [Serratia odorifera]